MLVLGVDPGTLVTGFAAVARQGGRFVCSRLGIIRPHRDLPLEERLLRVHDELDALVDTVRPDVLAVEDCFYARNLRSTLKLGHVKGIVLIVAARRKLPIHEYAPRKVKQSVVGNGNATKEQVRFMVERMVVHLAEGDDALDDEWSLDATDALAVAICHLHASQGVLPASVRGL